MSYIPDSAKGNTLSVALIVPDAMRRRSLAAALNGSQFTIAREFDTYPSAGNLPEIARLDMPCSRCGSRQGCRAGHACD